MSRVSEYLAGKYYEEGMSTFTQGDLDKAKELFKKSLFYKPDKAESLRALERIK
jgi:Tfp pilus assembly protein PilF